MKQEDFKIIFIKIPPQGYLAWIKSLPGICVQIDDMKDAPKELATSLEYLLKYGLKINNYEITDFTNEL